MPAVLPLQSHRTYYVLLALSLGLVAYAGWESVRSSKAMAEALAEAETSQAIIAKANDTLVAFGTTESFGLRWAVTFKPAHWRRFQASMDRLDAAAVILHDAVVSDPASQEDAAAVLRFVAERRRHGEAAWRRLNEGGIEATVALLREGTGERLGADVRRSIGSLVAEQQAVYGQREGALRQRMEESQRTILLAIGLGILAGLVGVLATMQSRRAWVREREALYQRERAEAASAEKSLFLATMSHEIRTPMNAIFGFSQLLGRRVHDPKAMEYVRAIRASGQSLLALINDLLDLSKIEAGHLELATSPTDVRELVDSTLAVFTEPAAGKGLRLTADIDPFLPPSLLLDPHRVRQILMNLVSNAVKYTDRGVIKVHVHADVMPSALIDLRIVVEDSGQGIPAKEIAHIFDPFHRVVPQNGSQVEGTGLGLSIVRRLVELMQGDVLVDSELGRGSVFTILLPGRVAVDPASLPGQRLGLDFALLAPSRFLIVDDVSLNRDLLSGYLADAGHEIAFADDGVSALAQVEAWHPTVVLMDIRMPRMDGREAAKRIRAMSDGSGLHIVAVTASSMDSDERSSRYLFDAYLRKPITAQELFDALLELVGIRRDPPGGSLQSPEEADADRHADIQPIGVDHETAMAALIELERIALARLPHLQSTMLMRDIRTFAQDLSTIGARGGLERVGTLGQRLEAAVDVFDLTTIDSLLDQLPRNIAAERFRLEPL